MSDFIVDESRFVLKDEDTVSFFPEEYKLACGITIAEKEDETDTWQLYTSKDGKHYILAVTSFLHDKWVESKLLSESDFQKVLVKGQDIYLVFSKTNKRLVRLTNISVHKSLRFALALYSAFAHTRNLDIESNLRDGIYFEDKSLILPTYSLVGKVKDKALFENCLREGVEAENLATPDGINDSLSFVYVKNYLNKKFAIKLQSEPLLESGEAVDDFMLGQNTHALIVAPLVLRAHYQVFDTTTDKYLLVMDKLWAEALMSTSLVSQISLNTAPIAGKIYYVYCLSKEFALENMDDRFFGLDHENAFELAQAIHRTRKIVKSSDLTKALYVQQLGVLLPEVFSEHTVDNDGALMGQCLCEGPFAMCPFMEDVNENLVTVASNI